MAERMSFDTTFLIDIQREIRGGRKGRAHSFLERHAETVMFVSAVALGEFAEGFNKTNDSNLQRMLAPIEILDIDLDTSLIYGVITRKLRTSGLLIGSNDLWIGCSALRHQIPLVTRDLEHFSRIEGLQVVGY
jgi:tRNA(fMet)-specific endonuclease VapC